MFVFMRNIRMIGSKILYMLFFMVTISSMHHCPSRNQMDCKPEQNFNIRSMTMILNVCGRQPKVAMGRLHSTLTNLTAARPRTGQNVAQMFKECSCGKASFNTYILPYRVDVEGQFCDMNESLKCDFVQWANVADKKVLSNDESLQTYKHRIYVLPDIPSCKFAGMGTLGPCGNQRNEVCRIWVRGTYATTASTYFHELGHNLGLRHAYYKDEEYGDISDAMGYCCQSRCFAAPFSNQLAWCPAVSTFSLNANQSLYRFIALQTNQYIIVTSSINKSIPHIYIQNRVKDFESAPSASDKFFGCLNIYSKQDDKNSNLLHILCQHPSHVKVDGFIPYLNIKLVDRRADSLAFYLYV